MPIYYFERDSTSRLHNAEKKTLEICPPTAKTKNNVYNCLYRISISPDIFYHIFILSLC